MNSGDLMKSFNYIDPALIERSEKRKDPARTIRRIAAVAAALLLIFGAAFGVAKAARAKEQAKLPEKFAFMSDNEVPADAVLPPSQMGNETAVFMPGHDDLYNIKRTYEESDVVCVVTIRDWLGETEGDLVALNTFYEAKVERVYKGDPGDSIVVVQAGSSDGLFNNKPLFTYGDKLLLGLVRYPKGPYANNAYSILGVELSVAYLATDNDGTVYVLDEVGEFSYWTEVECPELHFTNYADDQALVEELYKDLAKYDTGIVWALKGHWDGYYSDKESYLLNTAGFRPHVYSFEELDAFFAGME